MPNIQQALFRLYMLALVNAIIYSPIYTYPRIQTRVEQVYDQQDYTQKNVDHGCRHHVNTDTVAIVIIIIIKISTHCNWLFFRSTTRSWGEVQLH